MITIVLLEPVDLQHAYIFSSELAERKKAIFNGVSVFNINMVRGEMQTLVFTGEPTQINEIISEVTKRVDAVQGVGYTVALNSTTYFVPRPQNTSS